VLSGDSHADRTVSAALSLPSLASGPPRDPRRRVSRVGETRHGSGSRPSLTGPALARDAAGRSGSRNSRTVRRHRSVGVGEWERSTVCSDVSRHGCPRDPAPVLSAVPPRGVPSHRGVESPRTGTADVDALRYHSSSASDANSASSWTCSLAPSAIR
jgi:hypothetical protein